MIIYIYGIERLLVVKLKTQLINEIGCRHLFDSDNENWIFYLAMICV